MSYDSIFLYDIVKDAGVHIKQLLDDTECHTQDGFTCNSWEDKMEISLDSTLDLTTAEVGLVSLKLSSSVKMNSELTPHRVFSILTERCLQRY